MGDPGSNNLLNSQNPSMYRFDNFLEEARNLIKKSKASVYFHLIFARKGIWQDIENLMEEYSRDGRREWTVDLLRTQQDDFFILQFTKKKDEDETHRFFWKVISEDDNLAILSFSLEKFQFVKSCLRSFVVSTDMEFPWLGSAFLENLDDFVRTTFGADARLDIAKIIYDREPVAGKGRTETNLQFTAPLSKEDILKRKQNEYEQWHKFFYIRRVKASVSWKGVAFTFSISDESEILFEKGDLLLFIEAINALKNIASYYRGAARKRFDIETKEIMVDGKTAELRTINNLEILKIQIKEPMTEKWFENFIELFSTPYRVEENLMSFVLMKGNPYFLAHVIDLDKGGSGVYLSATENAVRIAPSSKVTSSTTVLKIVKALQKYVDPNITIVGA